MNINSVHNEKNSLKNQKSAEVKGNMSTSSADSGVIITDDNKNQLNRNNNNIEKSESDCNYKENNIKSVHSSPCASLRSLSISIVSIDDNNSSVVDSDFETDTAVHESKYVIHKLGTQTTYPAGSVQIPQLNQGLRVVSQVISQNDQISEEFRPNAAAGAAAVGAIAVTNSSDVTFGDKHYYEGPVTIQQFLIDSREKEAQNEAFNGEMNNGFMPDNDPSNDPTKSKNSPDDPNDFGIKLSQRKICYLFLLLLALLGLILTVFYTLLPSDMRTSKQPLDGDSIRLIYPINKELDKDRVGDAKSLRIIWRNDWLAQPPTKPLLSSVLPIPYVVVMPTLTNNCTKRPDCIHLVRNLQMLHIESEGYDDIKYNFLIADDIAIYQGRGWDFQGAHLRGYNHITLSLAFIGTFHTDPVSNVQMNLMKLFFEEGIKKGKLSKDFQLIPANALDPAIVAPSLYNSFKNLTNWNDKPILSTNSNNMY